MTKLLLAVLSAAVLGAGGLAAAAGLGGFEPAPVVSLPAASVTGTTSTNDDVAEPEDVRGPCDEAEHRNDPRCTGTPATTTREDNDNDDADEAEDLRGRDDAREDEAGDDRSGSDSGSSHGGDDRSGSNSGKG
jgi:hypothetical protein